MTRRELLSVLVLVRGPRGLTPSSHPAWDEGVRPRGTGPRTSTVETVTGPIAADALGVTLAHEHVLVDFVGADRVSPERYDRDAAFARALPHLTRIYALGCRTLVECTPAYLGRDPRLLRRLAEASRLQILTNTGYYGAAHDKFLPRHAFTETADQLAARWIREARDGVDGTDIKPAFMKIGVDAGPLSDMDAKLIRAAARTHRATRLPIYSHTGDGVAAVAQMAVLEDEHVPLDAFVWVHAQNEQDGAAHVRAARHGAWVSFDGISPQSIDRHVDCVLAMRTAGRLDRVLLSQDAGWYRVGEPDGGSYRPHDTLFTAFLPALKARGVTEQEVRRLTVDNPRRALARR